MSDAFRLASLATSAKPLLPMAIPIGLSPAFATAIPFGFRSNFGGEKYAAKGMTVRRYPGVASTSIRSSGGTVAMSWSIRCCRARSMTVR